MADSGDNNFFSNKATPTMSPVKCAHTMEARLPDESTMESTHATTQGIQYQRHYIDGLVQMNAVPIYRNISVMMHLVQPTAAMGEMKSQIKTLQSTNKEPKRRSYFWI